MMKNLNSHLEDLDPALAEMLAQLRPVPERDPRSEAQGLARFTAELEALEVNHVPPVIAPPVRALTFIDILKENYIMFTRRPALMGALAIVLIFVFLFGGTGITASAAQTSLPGDALYPLKTGLEMTQASLETDLGLRSQLYTEFAQRRLEEISSLIEAGRFEDIPAAISEFEEYIQKALQALSELAKSDPQRAIALNVEITEMVSRLTAELSGLLAQVPAPANAGESTSPTTETGADDTNSNDANGNDVNGNDANGNEANGNGAAVNDDNSNDANSNDANVNDDNGNDANINDDNGNVSDDDVNGNDDNSNDTNINDDDNGNDTNINGNGNGDDGSSGSGGDDNGGSGSGGGDDNGGSSGSGGGDDNGGSGGNDDGGNSGSGGGDDDD